jgi:hypothetical protein
VTKRALLVGINRYRNGSDLRGCVNDVTDIRELLLEYYDFPAGEISVLTDLDATKSAIETGLEKLLSNSRAGDTVFVHFSGHGSNVPDKSGDEADHRDEILCPSNLDWKDPLLDDSLRRLFDQAPKNVNITVVMDCCHSGTNTRVAFAPGAKQAVQRFLPCPLDLMAAESGRELTGALRGSRVKRRAQAGHSDIKDVNVPEILITGCRDYQTSADAYIAGDFHGALTYSLVDAIRQTNGKLTYRELHEASQRNLADGGFEQIPQLEGRAIQFDKQFLAAF